MMPYSVKYKCNIVGTRFRPEGLRALELMQQGDLVRLVREPENPHDSNAVAVYTGEIHVGYIGRRIAGAIAIRLDRGEKLRARVTLEPIIYHGDLKEPPEITITKED